MKILQNLFYFILYSAVVFFIVVESKRGKFHLTTTTTPSVPKEVYNFTLASLSCVAACFITGTGRLCGVSGVSIWSEVTCCQKAYCVNDWGASLVCTGTNNSIGLKC